MTPQRMIALTAAMMMALSPALAHAYSGPGVGLGALGVVAGIIGSVFLMTLSLIWYPIKRMIRAIRGTTPKRPTAVARAPKA